MTRHISDLTWDELDEAGLEAATEAVQARDRRREEIRQAGPPVALTALAAAAIVAKAKAARGRVRPPGMEGHFVELFDRLGNKIGMSQVISAPTVNYYRGKKKKKVFPSSQRQQSISRADVQSSSSPAELGRKNE